MAGPGLALEDRSLLCLPPTATVGGELQGKTVHQRGKALAAIARPDFRDELVEAAERASRGGSPLP